jgi:hypothetical protein
MDRRNKRKKRRVERRNKQVTKQKNGQNEKAGTEITEYG